MSTSTNGSIDPAEFGDSTAVNVGVSRHAIGSACDIAVKTLADLHTGFGVQKIQFLCNGTPAVASVGDTSNDVHLDWVARRDAYQQARAATT